MEKFNRRLTSWESEIISLAGRITLAKSFLNNLAVYQMQTGRFLVGVAKEIDRLMRQFVSGGNNNRRRIPTRLEDLVYAKG